MSVIDDELKQFGIDVVCPLKKDKVNAIADYVAKALCVKYPELKLDYKILYSGISITIPFSTYSIPTLINIFLRILIIMYQYLLYFLLSILI